MAIAVSPLAPESFPSIPRVPGVRLAAGAAGIRYRNRSDLLLVELAQGTHAGGVFTRSVLPGHPVTWCRQILPRSRARGLVVNAGNANVLNGEAGEAAVRSTAAAAARMFETVPEEIFVASTGVIGEPLPVERLTAALPDLGARLEPAGWEAAADAIRTTDTFPKGSFRQARIGETMVTIAGIAKGSGMIQPDMATLLAFLFTDARLPGSVLQALLSEKTGASFNAITVDGDTSTSDMLLLFATGQAEHADVIASGVPKLVPFEEALEEVMVDLARQVVRDGEGARKFISIAVRGAADHGSARRIALSVANSPLVKTAIGGEDANWGRIVMAVGKAGEPVDPDQLAIAFGGHTVARHGARVPELDEVPVAAHLKGSEILVEIGVGEGPGEALIWTSDLTEGYIRINGGYRT